MVGFDCALPQVYLWRNDQSTDVNEKKKKSLPFSLLGIQCCYVNGTEMQNKINTRSKKKIPWTNWNSNVILAYNYTSVYTRSNDVVVGHFVWDKCTTFYSMYNIRDICRRICTVNISISYLYKRIKVECTEQSTKCVWCDAKQTKSSHFRLRICNYVHTRKCEHMLVYVCSGLRDHIHKYSHRDQINRDYYHSRYLCSSISAFLICPFVRFGRFGCFTIATRSATHTHYYFIYEMVPWMPNGVHAKHQYMARPKPVYNYIICVYIHSICNEIRILPARGRE